MDDSTTSTNNTIYISCCVSPGGRNIAVHINLGYILESIHVVHTQNSNVDNTDTITTDNTATKPNQTKPNQTKPNKTKQNKTKQNKTKQNKNKIKQHIITNNKLYHQTIHYSIQNTGKIQNHNNNIKLKK